MDEEKRPPQHPNSGTFARLAIHDQDTWSEGPWKLLLHMGQPLGFVHLETGDWVPHTAVTFAKRV